MQTIRIKVAFTLAVCIVSCLKVYFVLQYYKSWPQRISAAREIKVIFILTQVASNMVIL